MNYEERLNVLKKDLDRSKELKYKANARLEELERQDKEIRKELEELNIKPENLEEEIARLEKNIEELFKKANEMLPKDLLGND